MKPRVLHRIHLAVTVTLILLIFHCLLWELWWAPLRPGGSMLALKALPLLIPLFGVLRGRRYTHQWLLFLLLVYVAEGAVRVSSDLGLKQAMAGVELALALACFLAAMAYARYTSPSRSS